MVLWIFLSTYNSYSKWHKEGYKGFSILMTIYLHFKQDLKKVFEVFTGQLRQLFGLKSHSFFTGASGTSILLASERGFTQWWNTASDLGLIQICSRIQILLVSHICLQEIETNDTILPNEYCRRVTIKRFSVLVIFQLTFTS